MTIAALRDELRASISGYGDRNTQVKKVYLDRPSFALADKHDVEFAIKKQIAERYGVPFRSIVFAGSAQLGFSPLKDTLFAQGRSDLDVACIDASLYQTIWYEVAEATRNFSDRSVYIAPDHAEKLETQVLTRAMILLDYLPKCARRVREDSFFNGLNARNRAYFGRVSLAVYLSEGAFCRKQTATLDAILG